MTTIKNLLSPALSNISILFPNKSYMAHRQHILHSSDNCNNDCGYEAKECSRRTRGQPPVEYGATPIPECDDDTKGVHSEIDMAYRKWDVYWPLYKDCARHVKRIETYPAGTDPNSNNKM